MPTVNLLLYLLLVGCVYLFRMGYIGWLGSYLFAAVIWIPLALLVLSLPSMILMQIQIQAPPILTKGKEASLLLRFHARTLLPVRRITLWLEVENRFTGEVTKKRCHFDGVVSDSGLLPLPTDSCGQLCCRITRVECRDLLGLISIRRHRPGPIVCTVMPEAKEPDLIPDFDTALNYSVHLVPKYGGGFSEEHDLRQYHPGDTVNSIHWKLSSKTDDVIVREPLVNRNQDVFLVLSKVGENDRGLETLYWLSLELCRREIPHTIVADTLYDAGNEKEAEEALSTLLAKPIAGPSPFDASNARCIFLVLEGEVQVK